ncbi:MAG TPA: site-2 protease family protein [Ktedonobacterales bacterium]|nr:site-2 protease family protein [Ktedonobacterales bacterium]
MYNNWYLLAAIPVFALLIIVHELGHFLAAKWADIRVDEFAIGFPPRLISFKRGETQYSINALPIGGYVRMPGEDGQTTDDYGRYDPRTFAAKPASKRLIVLLAGVTMNFLLAIVLFTAAEAVGQVQFHPVIASVEPGSPAQAVGLRVGDRILTVNGQPIKYFSDVQNDTTADLQAAYNKNHNVQTVPIILTIQRGNEKPFMVVVNARVHPPKNQGAMGIGEDLNNPIHLRPPLWKAPILGVEDVGVVATETYQGIQEVIQGRLAVEQAVAGPVGIVHITGEVASTVPVDGWYLMFFLTGALSLSLAFMNILPIPALDGGRVLLIIIEILRRGKRLTPEREGLVNLIGMAALLILIALVTINDISGLISGH